MILFRPHLSTCARILVLMLIAAGLTSCAATKPLRMREFSKNIIIAADGSVTIQDAASSIQSVITDLRARGIADTAYIVLHVHRNAPARVFDKVSALLADSGYENVTYEMYED